MNCTPFIIRFAKKRSPSVPIPGKYSEESAVTVVPTKKGVRPLVKSGSSVAELLTKTKVDRERDDEEGSFIHDLETKTFAEREKDDECFSFLSELLTKTDAEREKDE